MILPTIEDSSNHLQGFFRPSRILPTLYGLQNRAAAVPEIDETFIRKGTGSGDVDVSAIK